VEWKIRALSAQACSCFTMIPAFHPLLTEAAA
jgi:hypothetical protein